MNKFKNYFAKGQLPNQKAFVFFFNVLVVVISNSIQGLICCFSNRREKVSMVHFKENDIRRIKKIRQYNTLKHGSISTLFQNTY